MSTTPSPADLRRQRRLRIAQLRRRVLATSVATFALAFALVASDGSMGSSTKSRANATAQTTAAPATGTLDDRTVQQEQEQQLLDDGASDAGASDAGASSADPVQTGQS
jgi:hypothetical protein